MTAKDALTKLTVMLGLNTQEVVPTLETVETQFAEATLVDGTVVVTEGDLVEGATLYVVTPEGNVVAPSGMHQTEGGSIITVDDMGVITSIEDAAAEAPVAEAPATEVAAELADLPVDATPAEEAIVETVVEVTDEIVSQIAELIQPAIDEISTLKDEVAALKANFSSFKEEPAAKKITNNLSEYKKNEQSFADARFDALRKIRGGK